VAHDPDVVDNQNCLGTSKGSRENWAVRHFPRLEQGFGISRGRIPQVQYTSRQDSGAVRVVTASLAGLTVDAAGRLGAAERSAHARENAVESDPAGEDDQSHSELGDRAEIPRPFN